MSDTIHIFKRSLTQYADTLIKKIDESTSNAVQFPTSRESLLAIKKRLSSPTENLALEDLYNIRHTLDWYSLDITMFS